MSGARVLYVSEPEAMSGAELSLIELVRNLPDAVEPVVATPSARMVAVLEQHGIESVPIPAADFSFRLDPVHTTSGVAWILRTARELRRAAGALGADLVHANNTKADLPATLVGLGPGAPPVVCHVRDEMPATRSGRAVLAWTAKLSDAVIVNSRFIGEQFDGLCEVQVAYNSVDAGRFDPDSTDGAAVRSELGLADAPVVLVLGHFIPPKGQDDAVRMLAELKRVVPEARLLLVGSAKFNEAGRRFDSDAFLSEVRALTRDLGLEGDVVFAGERHDVPAVLAAADVLLSPSWREPFGRVLIEAMAMRVPVVAAREGGPSEVIRDGVEGLLGSPRDPAGWARLVSRILGDPGMAQRLGDAGRRTAIERFGARATVASVVDVYERVLAGRAA